MKYEPVPARKPSQVDPDYVPRIYTNRVHCTDAITDYGDTIQLGHYYRRNRDRIWVCVNCKEPRP